MLAKSLVLFIGIGVIAGLFFGVYLIEMRNTGLLIHVDYPSVSIVTQGSDHTRGEEIEIRIVNSGSVPLGFPDKSYGLYITGLSGILIYSPKPGGSAVSLEPGEGAVFVWDQRKDDGDTVLEGLYKIIVEGTDRNGDRVTESATVTIVK